jgi:hypothetical protein
MRPDLLALNQPSIRGADSNSLLRLYDLAVGISTNSPSPKERARASRVLQRITQELQRRHVRL